MLVENENSFKLLKYFNSSSNMPDLMATGIFIVGSVPHSDRAIS